MKFNKQIWNIKINGKPFLLWTNDRVYFLVIYDGKEWAGSVPRNPTSDFKLITHFAE
jgi:hypothetical protein